MPSGATRHALQRFTNGYTPALRKQVAQAGGFGRWFERQLAGAYSDAAYASTARWWHSINATQADIVARANADTEDYWRADANYQCWVLARRVTSQRQVLEVMTEFWEHHLHVPANGVAGPWRTAYGKTIRSLALTSFDQLLKAAVTHPAMSIFLTNANSSKDAPNENLARELLELHTVGRGQYGETDVKNSARILTGYRIDMWRTWAASYDPKRHWVGPIKVMDFTHANASADGRAAVNAYLGHLARHPATARRIAQKLAVRFVSDNPSSALVNHLANVYLANGTQIRPVLRAIIASPEFKRAVGAKVRTPSEDVVATWRALGVRFTAGPTRPDDRSGAASILWQTGNLGQPPFDWPRPDGRPDNAQAWSSTSRFLASLRVHYAMSGGWYPTMRTAYPSARSRLPRKRIRFDALVDHLSRTLLGRGSTALLLQVACEATGLRPSTVITRKHQLVASGMARLLTVFLDSPAHMTR